MIAFFIPILIAASCAMAASPQPNEISAGLSKFSVDLYSECAKSAPGNIIFSPFSISNALALLSQAAQGTTLDQIYQGMHINGEKNDIAEHFSSSSIALAKNKGDSVLDIANKLYVQEGYDIKAEFSKIAVDKFQSEAQSLNFGQSTAAAGTINQWVEQKTNHKIKDLISSDSLDAQTRLVLVNAVYFKSNWEIQFNKNRTTKGKFYTSETDTVDVDFMRIKDHFKFAYLDDLKSSGIELKYANSDISFVIILPDDRNGLPALEESLKTQDLTKITDKFYRQEVDVSIPKFKIEHEIPLTDILKELGMTNMFSDQADLGGLLNSDEKLKVSSAVHKAFIEINEEGSEAAAATGLVAVAYSLRFDEPKLFKADHPFLFAIRQSETTLFMGSIRKC